MNTGGGQSWAGALGLGVAAGLAGTAVMTAFQKIVEMPLTGRADSYAPAELAEKLLPLRPSSAGARKRINYAAHFGLGLNWGLAYAVAAKSGLRGQPAVAATFAAMYSGDVLLATALGIYEPAKWSVEEIGIDVVGKLVQAEATGAIFDAVRDRSAR